jgi:ATP-dependent DNA helicase RecQ
VLRCERRVEVIAAAVAPEPGRRGSRPRRDGAPAAIALGSEGAALFERLRTLRKQVADAQGVPPYVVFNDASLREMAARRPIDGAAFAAIAGVGTHKLAQYGPAFTAAIRAFQYAQAADVEDGDDPLDEGPHAV